MVKDTPKERNINQEETPTRTVGAVSKKKMDKDTTLIENSERRHSFGIAIFFIILVIICMGIGLVFSPTFDLNEVLIQDGNNITSGEISQVITVSYGENIFKQKYREIEENVKSLPYIKEAHVKPVLPNKIAITYEEREPYMMLKYLESFFVIDKQGYLLEIKKENNLPDLPVVYGIEIDSYALGESLGDTSRIKCKNVVMLLEIAAQIDFPYTIYEINYERIGEVKFWVRGFDIDIIYGEIDKNVISDKLNYLVGILDNLKDKSGILNMSSDNYLEKTIFKEIY